MTATTVGGLAVVADTPTASPHLTDNSGQPVVWQQIRTLTLADGSTFYGCAHCDYTSANLNSIRPHLGRHNRRSPAPPQPGPAAALTDLTLPKLLAKLDALERVTADRDQWKTRAQRAERALAALRRALQVDPR